eukprot:3805045-Pleurochrysis_carterae.AAC.1
MPCLQLSSAVFSYIDVTSVALDSNGASARSKQSKEWDVLCALPPSQARAARREWIKSAPD